MKVQRTPGEIRGCVVLATCRKVLDADPDIGSEIDKDIDGDMQITLDALREVGVDARPVAWNDSTFDWSSCRAVIVRSTWDYHRHIDEFLRWVSAVSQVTRLENSADVLRWNIDKRYLTELGAAGLPVIETMFVEPESRVGPDAIAEPNAVPELGGTQLKSVSWPEALDAMAARGDVVVKPAVSAGSNDTQRHGRVVSARAHVDDLLERGRVVMVQPYLDRVDAESETGLVYIDGVFSHAFSKGPMLAAPGNAVGELYLEEEIGTRTPTEAQRQLGDRVMASLTDRWGRLLYARVDMLPTDNGPVIIEVELTEPSLYLHLDPAAPARFASAIAARLD
jgi:hypothetical protein